MNEMVTQEITFPIRGMTCARCTEHIQSALSRVDGVVSAAVNYATERARVMYNPARTEAGILVTAVRAAGYDVPLESVAVPLHAIRTWSAMRSTIVDLRIDWRARRVIVERLAGHPIESTTVDHTSLGETLALLASLFQSAIRRRTTD